MSKIHHENELRRLKMKLANSFDEHKAIMDAAEGSGRELRKTEIRILDNLESDWDKITDAQEIVKKRINLSERL